MPPASPPKNKTEKKRPADYRVRIRMYRQGLGDCFLLTFPGKKGGLKHVMIDCGVVLGTPQPQVIMKKVAQSLIDETGVETTGRSGKKEKRGSIDVLVITHEHWDHVSAFTKGQAQAEFDKIDFGQLWMAWTEDDKNALAQSLRRDREKKKKAAAKTRAALKKAGAGAKRLARMDSLMGFFGIAAGGAADSGKTTGTKAALDYLKNKVSKCRTLKPGGPPIEIQGIEDVRVYVLGPPENKDLLHKTNPAKGEGFGLAGGDLGLASAFLAAFPGACEATAEAHQPFAKSFRKSAAACKDTSALYTARGQAWRKIDNDWLSVGERLALQLDNDTNNTSLVLAFEFIETSEVLLFVGDAQAGNWNSWEDLKWNIKDKQDIRTKVTAADLLERTVFYKVGHHGSHNATLREKGLDLMTDPNLVAMMPVDEKVAHEIKGWMHIPLPELCDRLASQCAAVARIDKGVATENAELKSALFTTPLYIDYYLRRNSH